MLRELNRLPHKNISRMLHHFVVGFDDGTLNLAIVLNYMQTDLKKFIKNYPRTTLQREIIKSIMYQLMDGLSYMHSLKIVHRDIKPSNILVSETGMVQLSDFGLAKVILDLQVVNNVKGSMLYSAPEVFADRGSNRASDVWSCGCIFAELYLKRPFFKRSEVDFPVNCFPIMYEKSTVEGVTLINVKTIDHLETIPLDYFKENIRQSNKEARYLLQLMLHCQKASRIEAKKALSQQFFKKVQVPFKIDWMNARHSLCEVRPHNLMISVIKDG
ncbi:hypothetical protein HELRODRAFT_97484 [Helobdella robusta]|uniref:cyclin-dependent kinase n=1 Tax=Helobdella robusta TaxID=6412 RepID=T1G9H1_HELRO|nr:hypothetical protein HELRODRAFT_97484 [Helobdella robusta]ESO09306.1 hypothetical protein HELRODRAFT_97484 [Helobdella robusta]